MPQSNTGDAWALAAATVAFSVPSCADELAGLVSTRARILDVGCGYGRVARELTERGFGNVIGYDSSEAMISRGRRESPELKLFLNEGSALPEPDESADGVVCCATLTCIPDAKARTRLIQEIVRVLRPSGILHVVEFARRKDRKYGAAGTFRSSLGIEMVHFVPEQLVSEFHSFQILTVRELDCRSLSGTQARAILIQGRKTDDDPASAGAACRGVPWDARDRCPR